MKFEPLSSEAEHKDTALSFPKCMFKLGSFIAEVKKAFESKGLDALGDTFKHRGGIPVWGDKERERWLGDGVDCEILKPGAKGWQKGKIRIRVSIEFCPDQPEISQPESPLDDIRQRINKEPQ
jgi:hypothetical protein